MALRSAVASGNWSNPAIWNGGVIPGPNDIVASNTYTVTIDQNITIDVLTNTAQTKNTIVPFMTSNTTPSGIASSNVGVAWQAFDDNSSYWLVQPAQVGDYVQYQFPTARAVDQYSFTNGTSFNGSVSLQGSNDGINFTTLHTASVVITGSGTYESPLIGNSTLYLYYRFVLNSAIYVQITFVRFFEYLGTVPATAGGTFTINSGVTVTCTNTSNSIVAGSITCLTIASASPNVVTINAAVVFGSQSTAYAMIKTGNCTLNFNGILDGNSNGALNINNSTGTTNIVGTVRKTGFSISSNPILQLGTGNTLNITGNITGNATGGGSTKQTFRSNGSSTITITGNVDGSLLSLVNDYVFSIGTNDIVNITGNVIGILGSFPLCNTITSTNAHYLKIVGSIIAGSGGPGVYSTNNGAINIFTGPFVSNANACLPFWVQRMNYQKTLGSYYEFRNSSTNGALPPAAPAPATRLVSPNTTIDSPIPANVRQGVNYALGTLTGTMKVPNPENVSKNVPIDNTIGTAVLSSADVWAVPTSELNEEGSIGQRLKNISTVESVGDQIVGLLSN
jgi:hypothetical protein